MVKPTQRRSRRTQTTRNHRFQSFSDRIAKLKIDPIRRRRGAEGQDELSEENETYFGRSLQEWKDLNLSQTFTTFAKEVSPYCDSLPVVLHNEDRIMDLLVAYMEKGDGLAMEPILNLLSQFAHDLSTRFEKHFERAVATVTAVASKHPDPAVIEWSFTCLAWLFKYLSRLLTPDLRPLYDLMSPYLGKEIQKPFIIRFAAESFSFLLRKAAATHSHDPVPLDTILCHMLADCSGTAQALDLHRQGVMTVLTEAMKSVQVGLHSNGDALMRSLLAAVVKRTDGDRHVLQEIVVGTLTSIIHHTTADTFQPILHIMLDSIQTMMLSDASNLGFAASLIFTVVSVRKATRIGSWNTIIKILQVLLERVEQVRPLDRETANLLLGALAITLQSATVDAVLPVLGLLGRLRQEPWTPHFLGFCDLFARLGSERYVSFLLPEFQSFVLKQWDQQPTELCSILPRLTAAGQGKKLSAPIEFQDNLIDRVNTVRSDMSCSHGVTTAHTALKTLMHVEVADFQQHRLKSLVFEIVQLALEADNTKILDAHTFAMGTCLAYLLGLTNQEVRLPTLWRKLCMTSRTFMTLPAFWANTLHYITTCKPADLDGAYMKVLVGSAVDALALPSHTIRESALEVMRELYTLRGSLVPEILTTAISIETTPVSLASSRAISMHIRRLAPLCASAGEELMQKAIPTYGFGLMHIRLAQAWDDAAQALSEMCASSTGESVIMALMQTWLDGTPDINDQSVESVTLMTVDSESVRVASDFECSNLMKISAIAKQVFEDPGSGYPPMEKQFHLDHQCTPLLAPNARAQALIILNKMPSLAEKRSRILVPVLLGWAGTAAMEDGESDHSILRWSRKDQKALLAIFAQFTNPKVLYKSTNVYQALLKLCANGDVEIQQSALKAISSWKIPAITHYETHLVNLLDEARFRDELSALLVDIVDGETVKHDHQADLMPVLLRLLYGRAVSGGKHVQGSRRKAIFVALSRFGQDTLRMFLDIATSMVLASSEPSSSHVQPPVKAPLRQQLGMLNMLNEFIETLGPELVPFAQTLLRAVLACTVPASEMLDVNSEDTELENRSLLRAIRQTGLQCLVQIYTNMESSELATETDTIVQKLIVPRLDNFSAENTQSVSGMLRLLSAWSASPTSAGFLVRPSQEILQRVADVLHGTSTKDEVRLFVLRDILDNLLREATKAEMLQPYIPTFVQSIGYVLDHQPSKEVLDACVLSLTQTTGRVQAPTQAKDIVQVCTGLLSKPNRLVSPFTKTGLLRTILPLQERFDIPRDAALYDAVSRLFSRLSDRASRAILSEVLVKLCEDEDDLARAASICQDFNAHSARLDEPDHERRERGFAKIHELSTELSLQQWLPVVHNCMFYIKDGEDLVNRSSASQALTHFINAVSRDPATFDPLLADVLAGVERGMAESSELVRAEYLRVLDCMVNNLAWPPVTDMKALAVQGDDEASFFTNVLHIQQHRRLRALRRLESAQVKSNSVTRIFMPLLEHFVFDPAEGDAGRTLADQTIVAIGALASSSLSWSALRSTFKRYLGYLKTKEDQEKIVLRLLSGLVDALRLPNESSADIVIQEFLPPLMQYLHHKDESTVDRRMPVAVTVAKLLLLLPQPELSQRLPAVLTDVSHVLRSRSQEARDQTRRALAAILSLIGPSYLGFMVKEMRSALQRGYQLHVLSFTVHSLLVQVTETCQPGDLDHCLPELMSIIMDDIFGITGQEKDAEEYKSGMKEVKSSKSFDTLELLARVTPINKLGLLMRPLRALLAEKLDSKMVRKADELLIRLRKGVDQNPAADSRDMLVYCHEVVREVYAEQNAPAADQAKQDYKVRKYLIQMESATKSKTKGATTSQMFKLISFALNLVRKVVRRHEDLLTPANMAGFLPVAGDALVQGQEEVKLAAMRLLATVVKLPLVELDTNSAVYIKEAVGLVRAAPSMTTDSAKAALELVTAVLREKRTVTVKEVDIAHILKALKADIDEPDRQGIIYKFLRAVLGRKVVITEVYDIMDEVGKVMVINPDRSIRESARSAYLQFVLDYPQGKDRWSKQASFLVENLKYEHASGRQSIMELLHQLLSKVSDEVLAQLGFTVFVALVPVQVTDADPACQQMAGILSVRLFERASDEQLRSYLALMDKWLGNNDRPMIQVASLRCWSTYLRARDVPKKSQASLRDRISELLTSEDLAVSPQLLRAILQTLPVFVDIAPDTAFAAHSKSIWQTVRQYLAAADADNQETASTLVGALFSHLASTSSKTTKGLGALPLRGSGGLELSRDDMRVFCRTSQRVLIAASDETTDTLLAQTIRNLVFLGRCFAANEMIWGDDMVQEPTVADGDQEEEDDGIDQPKRTSSAIAYLLNRLSYIIRQDTIPTKARSAAVQCQAALINQMQTVPNMVSALRPLYSLTDPSIPRPSTEAYRDLTDKAQELLDAIRKKVGSEAYIAALGEAQKEARAKREERRQKRKIEAVSAPERWAKEKRKKHEAQKTKKKLKGLEARGKRRGW